MNNQLILTLVSLVFVATTFAQPPPDQEATVKLVGNWIVPKQQYTSAVRGGAFTFAPGGRFTSYGLFAHDNRVDRVDVKGKWRINKGVLIEQITDSTNPNLVGVVTRDKLISITSSEYHTRAENGVEQWYTRR